MAHIRSILNGIIVLCLITCVDSCSRYPKLERVEIDQNSDEMIPLPKNIKSVVLYFGSGFDSTLVRISICGCEVFNDQISSIYGDYTGLDVFIHRADGFLMAEIGSGMKFKIWRCEDSISSPRIRIIVDGFEIDTEKLHSSTDRLMVDIYNKKIEFKETPYHPF